MSAINLSPIEKIKKESTGLRGTIVQGLADEITGAISEDDQAVIKFHGMYQQDDRDVREERAEKKLERLYSFMIRLRLPGGFLTPRQWIASHEIAGRNSTGVIKITSRQTIQQYGYECRVEAHGARRPYRAWLPVLFSGLDRGGDRL